MNRYITEFIKKDLEKKFVFISGPRQVGKTTLAKGYLNESSQEESYFNWDVLEHRQHLLKEKLPVSAPVLVLDEIHKYHRWRNLVKGLFDLYHKQQKIIVTGSARLDVYRKGGDSLLGRYHNYRLHPFSLPELVKIHSENENLIFEKLMQLGGFPEPYVSGDRQTWRRWHLARKQRIVDQDIRDLEKIQEQSKIELLMDLLPERVGSPLSIKSLREDLDVAHDTADRWLGILENMYYCFRLAPYQTKKARAVKKEKKLFLWDWTAIEDVGNRFENLVASHLLKYCHFIEDTQGYKMELCYLRDTDGREVDFIVLKERKILFCVEAKWSDRTPSPHLYYFKERLGIPQCFQVVGQGVSEGVHHREVTVLSFQEFCKTVGLV